MTPDRRLAPTTVTVIAAAAEQQEKHKDDQEKFHSVLHDVNCGTVECKWVWSNAGHSLGIYPDANHAVNPSRRFDPRLSRFRPFAHHAVIGQARDAPP